MWLYAGDPDANPGVKSGVQIGLRGWAPMSLSAAGDADRDGRVDLFARDADDEKLWLYRGHGDGTFGERTEYGRGYGTGNRPLLTGAGDADGNGIADVWATTNDGTGTLLFYAGKTNGAGDPVDGTRITVGPNGWNTIRAISERGISRRERRTSSGRVKGDVGNTLERVPHGPTPTSKRFEGGPDTPAGQAFAADAGGQLPQLAALPG
ncbi:FG-GAP repeat domain-containing protein [Streptomyces sp. NPDC058612]|uniref:FG-GAP repeat domain-containing protein n=1 Tax=Streptomyces sp. NPDC058612 TaxID=3346555 RepID=UPI003656B690